MECLFGIALFVIAWLGYLTLKLREQHKRSKNLEYNNHMHLAEIKKLKYGKETETTKTEAS